MALTGWQRQMEQMLGTWTQAQRRLWDNWLDAIKEFNAATEPGATQDQRNFQSNLEAWEQSVRHALQAQQEWTRNWTERLLGEEEAPEAAVQWVQHIQGTMRGWTEAQTQLWNAWFDSVKGMDPEEVSARWENEGQEIIRAWQEAAQRAQEALDEWVRMTGRRPVGDMPPPPPTAPPGRNADDEPARPDDPDDRE